MTFRWQHSDIIRASNCRELLFCTKCNSRTTVAKERILSGYIFGSEHFSCR